MADKIDFLAIGDTVTDAFIELKDVRIDTDLDQGDQGMQEICFRFGDKIEYEDVVVCPAVGNSPNAAVSAARLGLQTALVTNIGDDSFGKEDLDIFKKENIITDFVKVHEGMKSNYHYVLRFGPERTILVKHQAYTYSFPDVGTPTWMYLSSLGEQTQEYHKEISAYLLTHPEVKLAFQPGTFQMKMGYDALLNIYERTEVFFANREEYRRILETNEDDIKKLLPLMHERGPKIAILTDGPNGAYAYDGTHIWYTPMYPDPKSPVDRTGAGDSFSSTFTSALALGHDIPTALSWGPINSMSVVQEVGAQKGLLSREKIEEYLEHAPEDYKVQQIV